MNARQAKTIAQRPACRVHVPFALRLHAYGLSRLQDHDWCGENLYEYTKRPYRGREEPRFLFQHILEDGFLVQLGRWLFREYTDVDQWRESTDITQVVPYADDVVWMMRGAGVPAKDGIIKKLDRAYSRLPETPIWEWPAEAGQAHKTKLCDLLEEMVAKHEDALAIAERAYSGNYANRVFHDRELCEYISVLVLEIGIDGTTDDEPPSAWCKRTPIPEWAKRAIRARDRGKCSKCHVDMGMELDADMHFDHIVPLALGGCNDLVNLQLLCQSCNLSKAATRESVASSIPRYMTQRQST